MNVIDALRQNAVAATFVIIALGFLVGRVGVRGISLGTAGVLFVALAFGHWQLVDPPAFEVIGDLGVVLFVYAIGLRAGPRFVQTFLGKGRLLVQIALATIVGAAVCTAVLGRLLGIEPALIVGIFAGALTSTPALAAATEATQDPLVSVAYGVAYPVGVVGVVLFAQLVPRFLTARPAAADRRPDAPSAAPLEKRAFRVENPACTGRTLASLRLHEMVSANISRIVRDKQMLPGGRDEPLERGDVVVAVGTANQLDRLAVLMGPAVEVAPRQGTDVVARDIVITGQDVVGRTLMELQLPDRFGIVLTRVRRELIEFVPKGDFVLELGDQVRAAGAEADVAAFAGVAGIHERRVHETGIPAFATGLVLGLALGFVEIPVPWGGTVRLGLAGGPLVVGLLFGHFGRIGGLRIHVPPAARYLMRELGLLLFLVSAGTSAGAELMPVLESQGFALLLLAAVAVAVAMAIGLVLAFAVFKQSAASTIGMTCGAMTSTPGLGAASAQFESDTPALSYAAVYPLALVAMTVVAQFMVALLR